MRVLRAGIIGLGAMGINHARVLSSMDGVEVVGVVDPTLTDSTARGIPVVVGAATLLDDDLDCCVIAAPTAMHRDLCLLAAERDVSVLVEKPLAARYDEAAEMVGWFDDRDLVGVVGHIERFNPALIGLQQRLQAGQLGNLYQLTTRRQGPLPARISDVGVVMDLATHDIDLTQWVTGARYTSISAWTAHKSGREHEDLVIAAGRLDSGIVVSHHVNWLSPSKERVTIVTGEGGTLVADTVNVDLYFYENAALANVWPAVAVFRGIGEGDMTRYALSRAEPLRNELEAFIAAVRGDIDPAVTFHEGADVVRVAEAMLQSAPDGAQVMLPD